MKQEILIQLLAQRKKKNIKKKAPIPPRWLYPSNSEKQYDKVLYSLTKQLKHLIKTVLVPAIPSMIDEVERKMPNDSRNDSYLESIQGIILFIGQTMKGKVDETKLRAAFIGEEIQIFNKRQSGKLNHSIFGFDIFVDEPWLKDQLELFAFQNAQLIENITEKGIERAAQIVERGLQQGLRFTDMTASIQSTFGITDRHARLIARDQTQKLNSSLTKLRQQEVGVEEYVWSTSLDERVRSTHKKNEGKTFRWDTPPPVTGHPGHDINCRCVALPVLDKLLDLG